MTALEIERKYRTKTISGEKQGGDNTAKPTLSPPVVSCHSHSILSMHRNALIYKRSVETNTENGWMVPMITPLPPLIGRR